MRDVCFSDSALAYSAYINYWLVTEKLLDDYNDEKSVCKNFLRKILTSNRKFKKQKINYAYKTEDLSELLQDVYKSELNVKDLTGFDNISNKFGAFFKSIFCVDEIEIIDKQNKTKIEDIFFQIGKWIYVIDAFDDLEKDTKRKKFNLLYSLNDGKVITKEDAFTKTLAIHIQIKAKIKNLLSKLNEIELDACITNILHYGMDYTFYQISKKKYSEYVERVEKDGYFKLEFVDKLS